MVECYYCKKQASYSDYNFDIHDNPICLNCIKNQNMDGIHREYCNGCGRDIGERSYLGKELTEPGYYVRISSIAGKGLATLTYCKICLLRLPDRNEIVKKKLK
jgi:hypothetical protein